MGEFQTALNSILTDIGGSQDTSNTSPVASGGSPSTQPGWNGMQLGIIILLVFLIRAL